MLASYPSRPGQKNGGPLCWLPWLGSPPPSAPSFTLNISTFAYSFTALKFVPVLKLQPPELVTWMEPFFFIIFCFYFPFFCFSFLFSFLFFFPFFFFSYITEAFTGLTGAWASHLRWGKPPLAGPASKDCIWLAVSIALLHCCFKVVRSDQGHM